MKRTMILSLPLLLLGCGSTENTAGREQVRPVAEHHPDNVGIRGPHSADERIVVTADDRDIPGSRYTPIRSLGGAE